MAAVLGVDGCPAGWYAAWWEHGQLSGEIYRDLRELVKDHRGAKRILIDIPIGLLRDETRQLESEVRRLLGPRRSSVFPVPCLEAVYADDYSAANQINRARLGKGLSKQAWFICAKIRDANDLLAKTPELHSVIGECHPELAFSILNKEIPLNETKKTHKGREQRINLLSARLPAANEFIQDQMNQFKRKDLAQDDCLDALALLIAAQTATPLIISPQTGTHNIPIQMWAPQSKGNKTKGSGAINPLAN